MKELVVISGKGGTGKTSVVASFAALARGRMLADCDVDAADLHLVLAPAVQKREAFSAGVGAHVDAAACTGCGKCAEVCRFEAVNMDGPANDLTGTIDPIACEGCGVCGWFCPVEAIALTVSVNGEWYVSSTRHGPMVHARLGIAEENSGKLVTLIRKEAKRLAQENGLELIICDGSPGIGCPVIASITGANLVLIVTEPTMSGLHDLERVAGLAQGFGLQTAICINKSDINPDMTRQIACHARSVGLDVMGEVRYDPEVTKAQVRGLSVVEHGDGNAAQDIRRLWENVNAAMNGGSGDSTEKDT